MLAILNGQHFADNIFKCILDNFINIKGIGYQCIAEIRCIQHCALSETQ